MKEMLKGLVHSIRSRLLFKMLIIYSILTLVPLVVVSTTFYVRTSQLMEKDMTEAVQQELNETASRIDVSLYEVKKRLIELGNQTLIHSLMNMSVNTLSISPNQEHKMTSQATSELLTVELGEARQKIGNYVDNIYLLSNNGEVYAADDQRGLQYADAYPLLPFEFDRMAEWAFFTDDKRMACVLKIFAEGSSTSSDTEIGFLIMTLDPIKVTELYSHYEQETFFLTNSDNLIISSTALPSIGQVLDVRGPANLLVIRQKSQYADFQYVQLAKPGAGNIVKKQAVFSILVTVAAWAAVFGVTYWILKRVTNPIQQLTRLMRKAEREEYQLIKDVPTRDEISLLCQGYNQLVIETKELIEKNYKNELIAREAELKAIRMYINPHFLYNIMEYISIMSQSPEKAKHVPDVVQKLSSIFRFSIIPGDSFVPLETELSFVEKYLQIHKYRFGERLQFSVELPAMLRHVAVPRLILQPLVENSIVHGIDRLSYGGCIDIRIREDSFQLVIEISNDIPSSENMEGTSLVKDGRRMGLGSGLDNVNARIRHHYGKSYGVLFARTANKATVTMQMPIQIWQEEGA